MGKTKTAVLTGNTGDEKLTGKAAYEAKKRAQEAKEKAQVKGVGLKGGERIKAIDAGPVVELPSESGEPKLVKRSRKAPGRSEKYKAAKAKVDPTKLYALSEAIKLMKDTSYTSFDGTVELHTVLKKDGVSVNVKLPHSAGKAKIVEFADDKTLAKLKAGKVDFDVLLATADMMPKLVPFAKLLGPKGLMPNPKSGTLVKSAAEAKSFGGNSITIKTEKKAPLTHTAVGKVSQKEAELAANIEAALAALGKTQVVKASISATMGPGVKLALDK